MSYIGNNPVNQNFVAGADQFSGTGSQLAFTLSRNVNTVFDMFVTVSNVPQDPFTAYTVAGNTLTFDSAPPSGTNNIDVVYRATNVQTFVPSPGVSSQFGLGSVAAPSMTFIGDTNTGIYSPGADTLAFVEGGVEAMRINSSANVGIGTSSPSSKLHVAGGSGSTIRNTASAGSSWFVGSNVDSYILHNESNTPMLFTTNGTERMRIDSSGNVGIGTSSPSEKITVAGAISSTSNASNFDQAKATFDYASGAGRIASYASTGGSLLFFTNPNGGSSTERARINSSGNFLVGTTSTFDVTSGATTQLSGQCAVYNSGSPNTLMSFYNSSQSARVGFIGSSGNSTQYNSGSDYRLKDNVINMSGALSKISALRPVTFTWKVSPEVGLVSGFIAHELDEVVPEAVSGEKDAMCSDGVTPNYQMVDLSKLVPLLTAAIQELKAEVDQLRAQLEAK